MLDHQAGGAGRGEHLGHHGTHPGRAGRVEHRGGLVQEQHARTQRQHARERQPLPLPAGQVRGRAVQRHVEPDRVERLAHPCPDLGRRHAVVLQAERDVVAAAGEHGLRLRVLQQQAGGGVAARPGDGAGARLAGGDAVDEQGALLLAGAVLAAVEQAGEPGEQRRLARAAGPEQQHPLARLDVEVEPRTAQRGGRRAASPSRAG